MTSSADLRSGADQQLVDLIDEIADKMRRGEAVSLETCVREHPDCAERLRELFPALELMADLSVVHGDSSVSAATGCPSALASASPIAGVLGDFRIVREIGRGGMGIVYEAQQISLQRRVALKMLPFAAVMDARQLQRFKNEAVAAASLKHPHIVQVYSVGCERGVHYYAMEYVEGQTLADVIGQLRQLPGLASKDEPAEQSQVSQLTRSLAAGRLGLSPARPGSDTDTADYGPAEPAPDRTLPEVERTTSSTAETEREPQAHVSTDGTPRTPGFFRSVANWGTQAAEALEHAHQMGVVHRDIKPSNLLIDAKGHLLVTDFGLAQTRTGANLTMTGDLLGTLRYMSPEQAQGNRQVLDHRSDIYSLGVTLYEMLALRPPFESEDRHLLMHEIVDGDPPPPGQVNHAIPRDLETIVLKAIAAEPQSRYTTAQELADDLQRFLADEPIHARRTSLANRAAKWARRHRPVVLSAVILLVTATVAIAGLAWNRYRQSVQLASDVGAHVAAADAFLKSADYAAGDRELADARGHLETADYGAGPLSEEVDRLTAEFAAKRQAIEQFDQFQQLRHRIHSEMYAVDRDILDQAQTHCRAALDLFGVFEATPWKSQTDFENLDTARQTMLDEGAVELLFVWARLEIGKSEAQPAAERNAGYRRAIEALGKVEKSHPSIPAVALWTADCWEALGKQQAAAEARAQAASLQPTSATDYYLLGEHHAQHGQQEQALASYWQALARQPDHYLSVLAAGVALGALQEYKSAEAMLTGAIAMNPQSVLAYAKRGVSRLGQGKLLLAQADFQQAKKLDPELAKALIRRGWENVENLDFDKAIADCSEAIQLDPSFAGAYVLRSTEYLLKGDREKALADCTEAMRLDPKDAFPYTVLASIERDNGNYDKAIAHANDAVRIDPNLFDSYAQRSMTYLCKGDLEKALADIDTAVRLCPQYGWIRKIRGDVYKSKGSPEIALVEYGEAIRLTPKHIWSYTARARIYIEKRAFEKALADCNEVIRLTPTRYDGYVMRAEVHLAMGDSPKALADYSEAIRLAPSSVWPYVSRAAFHRERGDFETALADSNEAIRLNPNDASTYVSRADTYRAMRQLDKGLADMNEAIRLNPEDPGRYGQRGHFHRERGDLDKALADYSEAIRLNPRFLAAYQARASLHSDRGDFEKALADYNEAIRLVPRDANGYAERGCLYLDMHEFEKAAADLDRAAELGPISWHFYKRAGLAHFRLQHYDKALEYIAKAVESKPEADSNLWWIPPAEVAKCPDERLRQGLLELADTAIEKTEGKAGEVYAARGFLRLAFGHQEEALADFRRATELEPNNAVLWYQFAMAQLAAGHVDDYRAQCGEMLQRFGQTDKASDGHWIAWACTLAPDAITDWATAVTLAEKVVQSEPKSVLYLNTLGAVLYRAGRFDEALVRLSEVEPLVQEPSKAIKSPPAYTWYFLAMTQQRLGHAEESKQWLDKAVAWTDKTTTEADQGKADLPWNRRLTLRLLRDEATTLLGVTLPIVESAPEPAAKVEEKSK